jgi:hypothetical protein
VKLKFDTSRLKAGLTSPVLLLALVALPAAVWPGPAIGLAATILLILGLRDTARRWDDPVPFRLFLIGLAVRFPFIILFTVLSLRQGYVFTLFGDSSLNFRVSFDALTMYIGSIKYEGTHLVPTWYGYSFLNWVYGALYYLFGFSPFLALLFNQLASCLAGWMVYLIAFRLTGSRRPARWAMGLTVLWPSLILWSINLLKEPFLELYLATIIYLFVDLIQRRKWSNLLWLALIWYPVGLIRKQTNWVTLLVLGTSLILFLPRRKLTGVLILGCLALAGAAKLGPARLAEQFQKFQVQVIGSQMGNYTTGGSYYLFLPSHIQPPNGYGGPMTPSEFVVSTVRAIYYYLVSPNPLHADRLSKLAVVPQMTVWCLMLLLCFPVGVLYLLQHRYRASGVLLVFLLVFTPLMALFTGNEATAFRQRDMLSPFFFIPIGIGLANLLGWLSARLERRAGTGR